MASQYLGSLNLKEKVVKGDGNCFFRCFAHQYFNLDLEGRIIEETIFKLRAEAVDYWLKRISDSDVRAVFLIKSSESNSSKFIPNEDERILVYLENMRSGIEWADAEIIVALSLIYEVKLEILMSCSGQVFRIGENYTKTIYLVYYNGMHYNTVEPLPSNFQVNSTQVMFMSNLLRKQFILISIFIGFLN